MDSAAMPIKIRLNQFEDKINPLQNTIKDKPGSEKTSNLQDQKVQKRQKPLGLVVKVINGGINEPNKLNLDLCARRFINVTHDKYSVHYNSKENSTHLGSNTTFDMNLTFFNSPYYNSNVNENFSPQSDVHKNVNVMSQFLTPENLLKPANSKFIKIHSNSKESDTTAMNILETSLKKVHENNRQIQSNLYVLNKALNYSMKKNEMLENVYPKSQKIFPRETEYEMGLERNALQPIGCSEAVQRSQMVWSCSACYQVWPRQDLLMQHSMHCIPQSEVEYAQPTKVSLLMQCEFCEKVFANSTRLLRHSTTHTTASNYECGACYVGFPSYIETQQHWQRCELLNRYYNFTLPKMLLCNMCDNIFREYQQLYNHRYKAGHFFIKLHHNYAKNAEISVYQCELCAETFPSVSHLLLHRQSLHPHIIKAPKHVKL